MVSARDINDFARRVQEIFSPERIVLFGSYAAGTASRDSDVDLLVIMDHRKRNVEQAIEISHRIDRSFPLDLIVRTPRETRRRIRQHDMFLASILEEGKTLYERNGQRMDRQSRRGLRNRAA